MQFSSRLSLILLLTSSLSASIAPAFALPPPTDKPEEILRTEIITTARSPIDGKPLSAREYAELQARMEAEQTIAVVPRGAQDVINRLRIRRTIRTFFPFLLR